MDKAKKEAERRILTRFLSNQTLKVMAAAVRDMDPPDFSFDLFENNEFKEVSVELTRIFNPALKQKEAAQEKIVAIAKRKFKNLRNEELVVYVDFANQPMPFDNKSLEEIATELCNAVVLIARSNEGYEYRIESKNARPFNKYIESITVSTEHGFENWQPFGAFRVPHIDETWFSDIVTAKENKIKNYPKNFDYKWVVLISNFGHESSAFQFSSIKPNFETSAFDRIFIYQYFNDEVIVLK